MNKTGGVISIIAGVFAVIAALVTLMFGGLASAFNADKASTVVGLGWGGVLFSFMVIVFGSLAFSKPKLAGWGLVISSILGAILGGTLVAIFMVLSLVGGILTLLGSKRAVGNRSPSMQNASENNVADAAIVERNNTGVVTPKSKAWLWIVAALIVIPAILFVIGKASKNVPSSVDLEKISLSNVTNETKAIDDLVQSEDSMIRAKSLSEFADLPDNPKENEEKLAQFIARVSGVDNATSIQKQKQKEELLKNLENSKGKTVIWNLVVNDVSQKGGNYLLKNKCSMYEGKENPLDQMVIFQKAQPLMEAILFSRNAEDKRAIEALKNCGFIRIKGKISDYDKQGKIYLNPAILIAADDYEAVGVKGYKDAEKAESVPVKADTVASLPVQATVITTATPSDKENTSTNNSVMLPKVESVKTSEVKTLAVLDAELNQVYKQLMAQLSKDQQGELKREEISWIRTKDKDCIIDKVCLSLRTDTRLQELKKRLLQSQSN